MISIMSKLSNGSIVANNCRTERAGIATPQILQNILDWQDNKTNYYQVQQKDLYEGEECYIRITGAGGNESSPIQVLLNKVKRLGTPLGRLCIINQGVVSGCDCVSTRNMKKLKNTANIQNGDGIFVFDLENKRDRITIAGFSAEERKLLRPFFKNTDTKRYWCKTKETKLLLYLGRNHQSIQEYPNVSKYLQNYCAILEDRREVKTKRICYFQLQWPRTESIFTTPKITVPYRSKINSFAYNEIEWFCRSDSYVITSKDTEVELKYVLSLLNSKLYYMWLYHKGKRKGDALELFQVPLSEIPIKKITFIRQKPFVDIVDQILAVTDDDNYFGNPMKQSQVKEYERQIDQLVYELYGLTTEEIAVVEGSTASK